MKTFCIYLPPDNLNNRADAIFLPDDKPYLALLAPPIWLAWHQLWWALLVYLAVILSILLLVLTPFRDAVVLISLLPGMYIWLEGHKLIQQRFELQGWIFQGVVGANSLADAELKYYANKHVNKSGTDFIQKETAEIPDPQLKPRPSTVQSLGIFPVET